MGKFIKNITLLFNFSFIFLHNLHLIYNDLYEKQWIYNLIFLMFSP